MKKRVTVVLSIAASLLIGCGIGSFYSKNLASTILIGSVGTLVGGCLVWFKHDSEINRVRNNLNTQITLLDGEKTQDKKLITELQESKAFILEQLNESKQSVEKLEQSETKNVADLNSAKHSIEVLTNQVTELETSLRYITAQRDEFKSNTEFKEQELKAFESTFDSELEKAYQKTLKAEVEKETDKHFDLVAESQEIVSEMDKLMKEIYQRHQQQRFYTLDVNEKFFQYKQASDEKMQEAYKSLEDEKILLENSVQLLKQQLKDGLIHPVYGEYGVTSDEGKNINGMIEWCFRHLHIPFRALKFELKEDIVTFGLDYQKSQNPSAICELLNQNKDAIKSYLGIWAFTRIEYLPKYDVIAVGYRQYAPKPDIDDEIYKKGLIPARDFCDFIFKATDHTHQGFPNMRIMAPIGQGKGIVAKNLVYYFSQLEGWEVWVSDPLHGSNQDYWDCAKVAKNSKESKEAYKKFVELHHTRYDLKIDGFTNRNVLGIFDEFDKQHDSSDKDAAKEIATALRHTHQRQILVGQSGEVGDSGWKWDEMNNFCLLAIGTAIGTVCKHLVKDMGWSTSKAGDVKRGYDDYSKWAQLKNDTNPDIPNENRYRIGLLIVGERFNFLELPIAHKGILRSGAGVIRENFTSTASANTQSQNLSNSNDNDYKPDVAVNLKPEIVCTHCGSSDFTRYRGVKKDKSLFEYRCKGCKKSFKSWNNKFN